VGQDDGELANQIPRRSTRVTDELLDRWWGKQEASFSSPTLFDGDGDDDDE